MIGKPYTSPACRIEEHQECPGPRRIFSAGAQPWEHPVEILRCSCACHQDRRTKTPATGRPWTARPVAGQQGGEAVPARHRRDYTMRADTGFEFVSMCRDNKVNNCPEIAVNVPGTVAVRDSERPDEVVTMTTAGWSQLATAVKAGEYDL